MQMTATQINSAFTQRSRTYGFQVRKLISKIEENGVTGEEAAAFFEATQTHNDRLSYSARTAIREFIAEHQAAPANDASATDPAATDIAATDTAAADTAASDTAAPIATDDVSAVSDAGLSALPDGTYWVPMDFSFYDLRAEVTKKGDKVTVSWANHLSGFHKRGRHTIRGGRVVDGQFQWRVGSDGQVNGEVKHWSRGRGDQISGNVTFEDGQLRVSLGVKQSGPTLSHTFRGSGSVDTRFTTLPEGWTAETVSARYGARLSNSKTEVRFVKDNEGNRYVMSKLFGGEPIKLDDKGLARTGNYKVFTRGHEITPGTDVSISWKGHSTWGAAIPEWF